MSTFWAMNNMRNATKASMQAESAASSARQAASQVEELQMRCDRALLVCEALWTLMRDRLGISEEDLVSRVNEIDLSDGRLDGRVKKANAASCPSCGRTISKRFPKCIYCGQAIVHDPFA